MQIFKKRTNLGNQVFQNNITCKNTVHDVIQYEIICLSVCLFVCWIFYDLGNCRLILMHFFTSDTNFRKVFRLYNSLALLVRVRQ